MGGKLTIGRKGYWIATAVLMTIQGFGPTGLGLALLAPWIMLYLARLRNAGRSAAHLLHVAGAVVLIFIPVFATPEAFGAYMADVPPIGPLPIADTIVFLVCIVGAVAYYIAFSIWLGCIKTKAATDPAAIADAFF